RPKPSPSARLRSPVTTSLLDVITPGRRTAPASLPMRSTRLAARMRPRRCGSGTGSQLLISLSPHDPLLGWPRTLLAKVKPTTRRFRLIFEVGLGGTFLEIQVKQEAHSTRFPAPSSALYAVVVIPMAVQDFSGFMSPT